MINALLPNVGKDILASCFSRPDEEFYQRQKGARTCCPSNAPCDAALLGECHPPMPFLAASWPLGRS